MKRRRFALAILAGLAVCGLVASGPSSSADSEADAGIFAAPPPSAPTISLYPAEFPRTEAGRTTGPMAAIVTNTASQAIIISSTTLTDLTNFSMPSAENGCLNKNLPKKNDYCTINIYFQPQTAGHISASLSVTYYKDLSTSKAVAGTAYVPPVTPSTSSVDFGQKTINTGRETRTVTLANNALIPIEIRSIQVVSSGSTTPFDAEQGCVTTIAAGASCDMVVGFDPTEAGSYTASVAIRDGFDQDVEVDLAGAGTLPGQPDIGLSTNAIEFGRVQVGSTSVSMPVTLVSTGTVNLTIDSITTSGDFAVAGDCVKTLAPAEYCTIQVTFTPSAGGEREGDVTITDNAPDSPQAVALSGAGVDPGHPAIDLSATSLDFGSQTMGATGETLYVVLENVGGATLTVSDVQATGDFSQENDCTGAVAAGGRCAIAVGFAPTALGPRTGVITITDDAAGSPHTVSLAGSGTEAGTPQALLSAASVDFGTQEIFTQSAAQTITLTNNGNADLSVGLTSIDGEGSASFNRRDTCRESVVEPQTSCSIDVVFSPLSEGVLAATLSIDDDAIGSPQLAAFSGTGVVLSVSGSGCRLAGGGANGLGSFVILMALAAVVLVRHFNLARFFTVIKISRN